MDLGFALAGLLVGVLVGTTGVGGGSVMTPLLTTGFGVRPAIAVGTDLVFAALAKNAGTAMHRLQDSIDWYDGPTVLQALEAIGPSAQSAHDALRLPVQILVRPQSNGDFRGYTGRIESGVLMQGAEVRALPSGRSTRVRDIVGLEASNATVDAGMIE